MTDLEILDEYCEKCLFDGPHPVIFRDIESRGLTRFINYLPNNKAQAKSVIRARLSAAGRYCGDAEMEAVAALIARLEALRQKLNKTNIADAHKVAPLLSEMQVLTSRLLNFYQ